MNERFSFEKAFELMKKGYKVKLPTWGGYWYWDAEKETIMMHCRVQDSDNGKGVLDIRETQRVEYTLHNILSDEWMIANEENCTVLGGEVTFGFEDALKYVKRGIKVRRKAWVQNAYLYMETNDVAIYENNEDFLYKSLAMCIKDGAGKPTCFIGWKPEGQIDLLSEDWCFCD